MRRLVLAVVCTAAAVIITSGCGGSSDSSASGDTATTEAATTEATTTEGSASGELSGTVGPGFDISMVQKTATAGTYKLTVDDKSSSHNFHFTGPGEVDVSTEVSATGTKTFTVELQKGTYKFVCDPHPFMNGTLTVK